MLQQTLDVGNLQIPLQSLSPNIGKIKTKSSASVSRINRTESVPNKEKINKNNINH